MNRLERENLRSFLIEKKQSLQQKEDFKSLKIETYLL